MLTLHPLHEGSSEDFPIIILSIIILQKNERNDDSNSDTRTTNYRYAPVLERLLDEGYRLTSCPFTLAARAVLRNAGFAATEMQWRVLNDRNAEMKMELRVAGQEFDEDKIGRIMDSA